MLIRGPNAIFSYYEHQDHFLVSDTCYNDFVLQLENKLSTHIGGLTFSMTALLDS